MQFSTKARIWTIAIAGLFVFGSGAQADIINVPGDQPTIQAAIDVAFAGDEIVVAPGTYFETINFLGKAITLRSSEGLEVTTIDADFTGTVVTCNSGEGPGTVLQGFTITSGFVLDGNGGGMLNLNSSPTVTDCTFIGNIAFSRGGGMHNEDSSPTVTNCTFSMNTAIEGRGGGMSITHGSPTVTNCTFSANSADLGGGGMSILSSNPTVTNCTFNNNSADRGGGVLNNSSSPTVSDCAFNGNSASGPSSRGGGMYNHASNPTAINCSFTANSAGQGGGMYNYVSNPTVINSRFTNNTTVFGGGGMYNHTSNPTAINCSFTANSAGFGGGIYNQQSSNLIVTNCTLTGNFALSGGGIYNQNSGNSTVTNCILWNNRPSEIIGGPPLVTYSDIEGGWPGEGNLDLDPLFVESGFWDDNGTPGILDDDFWVEGDYHLLPGSPCIDTGDNTAVPNGIVTDLDGNPRILDGNNDGDAFVDMGAFEFQACLTDLNDDDSVGPFDLALLLGSWGPCLGDCQADFNGDGVIGPFDLAILLAAWGPCK